MKSRNFGLDILRAFSIWLVLLQHSGLNIPGFESLKIGTIGVEVFFVLSGFLIGGILLKEIEKGNSIFTTLKRFWTRRWLRILPLYYLVLFFKFIVIDHSIGTNIIYYILFLQNNFYGIDFLPVSWSLVIEEWFYLFAPFLMLFVHKLFKGNKNIILSISAFIVCVVLLRFYFAHFRDTPFRGINSNWILRMDSLFLGVLLSVLARYFKDVFKALANEFFFLSGFILFIGYSFWINSFSLEEIDSILFFRVFGYLFLPLSIAFMIPLISEKIRATKMFKKIGLVSFITWTSLLTYAIYLVHPFVYDWLLKFGGIWRLPAYVLTYLIAFILYRFFERPILNFRDNVVKKE